jgi:diacylglycerol kinase family enzyme
LLDVAVFTRVNWLMLARCGPSLLLRKKLPAGGVVHLRAESFTLTCATEAPMEVEGDLAGHLPATFSVQRSRLRVVVP